MGKWFLLDADRRKKGLGIWPVSNKDGQVCFNVTGEKSTAEQIVREHNAHAELVQCLSAMLKITCGDCFGENPGSCPADPVACALSAQARTAIAMAEGRG